MPKTAATVEGYIASAPENQRQVLEELRAMIRGALPDASEQISDNGFAVYTIGDEWIAGFATRAKGPMLYIMKPGVLDRHEEQLGSLRSGKSCIEFREKRGGLSLDELRALARRMLDEAS